MDKNRQIQILDTTLRDGSYSINFQFTASDTALIAKNLEDAGIELIEIGHGIGLGASNKGYGVARETDKVYLEVAAKVLQKAKFGMFCIPDIASLDDISLLADNGGSFIRIGIEMTKLAKAKEYIQLAKKLNLFVCVNFMKSYTVEPENFADACLHVEEIGADAIYLVDSAGGMLPNDIKEYFYAIRKKTKVTAGFHGHNNIGMAVANTLCAMEYGATILDTSLQGLGRSAGNASTEQVVAILKRENICNEIDIMKLYDLGENMIPPLLSERGISSLDVVSGISLFHSSYMGKVAKYASKYSIDPRVLITKLCEHDRLNAPDDLLDTLAQNIQEQIEGSITTRFHAHKYFGEEQK